MAPTVPTDPRAVPMNESPDLMHILDAAYQTVSEYPGGATSLAPRVGLAPGTLSNKVNPNCSTNHLTLAEANKLMAVTGDHGILQAMASDHGYVLIRVEGGAEEGDVLHGMLDLGVAEGNFSRELHDALADGVITGNEMAGLSRSAVAYQGALIGLLRRLRAEHSRRGAPQES